jgi:hypothetical protein
LLLLFVGFGILVKKYEELGRNEEFSFFLAAAAKRLLFFEIYNSGF